MIFLAGLRRRPDHAHDPAAFPWSVPVIAGLEALEFTAPVTFLVGENGAGKSTLLEGIAAGMDAVAVGSRDLRRDPSLSGGPRLRRRLPVRPPPPCADPAISPRRGRLRLHQPGRGRDGRPGRRRADAGGDAARRLRPADRHRRGARSALALRASYGENPDGRSHGETFLALLGRRLVPNGLYFLDEPETPLSPSRVLALMALIAARVAQGCQFVIATHSPILMALPGATILLAERGRLAPSAWDDLEHVRVTRAFLRDPASVLAKLLPP